MSKQAKAVAKKAVKAVKATATKIEKKLTTAIKATKRRGSVAPVISKDGDVSGVSSKQQALKAIKARKVTGVVNPGEPDQQKVTTAEVTKKAAAKLPAVKAAVKVATKVASVKPVAPEVTGPKNPRALIISMLMERQYTDDEIHAEVVKQFGGDRYTTKKAYIQLTRGDVNCGNVKHLLVDGSLTTYVNRIVLNEKGEKVELPYKPSNLRKTELQFDLQQ
jgi:hypothetical protein